MKNKILSFGIDKGITLWFKGLSAQWYIVSSCPYSVNNFAIDPNEEMLVLNVSGEREDDNIVLNPVTLENSILKSRGTLIGKL